MTVPSGAKDHTGQQEEGEAAGAGRPSEKKSKRRVREREREEEGRPLSEWTTEEVCLWMGEVLEDEGVSPETYGRYATNLAAHEIRGAHILRYKTLMQNSY